MTKEGANVVMKWTKFLLKPKTIFEHNTPNFYTPLTSQVEALATPLESIHSILVAPPLGQNTTPPVSAAHHRSLSKPTTPPIRHTADAAREPIFQCLLGRYILIREMLAVYNQIVHRVIERYLAGMAPNYPPLPVCTVHQASPPKQAALLHPAPGPCG